MHVGFFGAKIRVSSANWRCFKLTFAFPISTGWMRFMWCAFFRMWTRASLTRMNRYGDRGSPCLNPFSILNGYNGEPFRRIDMEAVETQFIIHLIHFRPKPSLPITSSKNDQFTESYAFWKSSLIRVPGIFFFLNHLRDSFAIKTPSRICRFMTKALWDSSMRVSMTSLSRVDRILAMIFYRAPTMLIGL